MNDFEQMSDELDQVFCKHGQWWHYDVPPNSSLQIVLRQERIYMRYNEIRHRVHCLKFTFEWQVNEFSLYWSLSHSPVHDQTKRAVMSWRTCWSLMHLKHLASSANLRSRMDRYKHTCRNSNGLRMLPCRPPETTGNNSE